MRKRKKSPSRQWRVPPKAKLIDARERRAEDFRRVELPTPDKWDEGKTGYAKWLYLDASTYQVDKLFDTRPAALEEICEEDTFVVSPHGQFIHQNRIIHVGAPLSLHGYGHVFFSDDVCVPMLLDTHIDSRGHCFPRSLLMTTRVWFANVWMSLTPNEMISQRDGIEAAHGTVVVGGLGMGWFVRKVCEKDSVERVIVVEKSQDLLDWYGYDLCTTHPKVTDVICGDVYDQIDRHGEDAVYLFDIWPTQEGANHDAHFQLAKNRLGSRLWGWGWRTSASLASPA